MSRTQLTNTSLREGIWTGTLNYAGAHEPEIEVTVQGQPLAGLELTPTGQGEWTLRLPIPASVISEGVQTFLVTDKADEAVLGHFTLIAGEPLDHDIRAELALLRAELDLLKRAFRRQARET